MKAEQRELLAQAVSALQIRDVMLNECSFRRPSPPPTDVEAAEVRQLTKRAVRYVMGEVPSEDGATTKLLQVTVALGIRIAAMNAKKPQVYFEIEADFLVEYDVKTEVSEAAIKAFADLNSVHNVWPFWRQHVFDTVSRGRLPHLEVPLFSGLLPQLQSSKAKTTSRQKSRALST